MRAALIAIASVFTLSGAAAAAEPATAPPAQTVSAVEASNPDRIICKHMIHEGVLLQAVRCNTKRGWERSRRETQKFVSDLELRSFVGRLH
ncbi:MAG TPA: hypothetical protein VG819_06090 [Rhizomicrobium sp.]|jgi:hypothetical protein|nr:hypothetical protein [Rhizomicrobium sp.]